MLVTETAHQNIKNNRLKGLAVVLLAVLVLIQIGPFAVPGIFVQAETRHGPDRQSYRQRRQHPQRTRNLLRKTLYDLPGSCRPGQCRDNRRSCQSLRRSMVPGNLVYSGSTLSGYVVAALSRWIRRPKQPPLRRQPHPKQLRRPARLPAKRAPAPKQRPSNRRRAKPVQLKPAGRVNRLPRQPLISSSF